MNSSNVAIKETHVHSLVCIPFCQSLNKKQQDKKKLIIKLEITFKEILDAKKDGLRIPNS